LIARDEPTNRSSEILEFTIFNQGLYAVGIVVGIVSINIERCQSLTPKHDFRFKHPFYSLDASTIDLCLSVFPWAGFRTTKGTIKLHVGLNHAGYLPEFVAITEGSVHKGTVKLTNKSKMIGTNGHPRNQQAHVTCCHISNDRFLSNR